MKTYKRLLHVSIIPVLIVFLTACTGSLLHYRGAWVDDPKRIALQPDGTQDAVWQTDDLKIDFSYVIDGDAITLSSQVSLADYLTNGFITLERLHVGVLFLSADGTVIADHPVGRSGYRQWIDTLGNLTFDRRYSLPTDTAAIAFTYNGRVTDGGGSGGVDRAGERVDWDFWHVPGRKSANALTGVDAAFVRLFDPEKGAVGNSQ